jgi:hypothetical protein
MEMPTYALHLSELKQFRKEFIKARVEAYIETCKKISTHPKESDYQEFFDQISGDNLHGTGLVAIDGSTNSRYGVIFENLVGVSRIRE